MRAAIASLLFAIALSTHVWGAETITGNASVVDGDTIEIHDVRIRFEGIDAPESSQLCIRNGEKYRCGREVSIGVTR